MKSDVTNLQYYKYININYGMLNVAKFNKSILWSLPNIYIVKV
jgi:hypothetical protein